MPDVVRYDALMDVVRNRLTTRAFRDIAVPRAHIEMVLETARHAPSGANAQALEEDAAADRDEAKMD